MEFLDPTVIDDLLTTYKTWAIVGASKDSNRASNSVMEYLQQMGFRTIPINPNEGNILGERCYPSLNDASLEHRIEIVDIFRKPSKVQPIVEDAIEIGAKGIWLQLGVINMEAAQQAKEAGLKVVMDACPRIELPKLLRKPFAL